MTDFGAAAADYLAMRRAMGYKLAQQGQMLTQFVIYLHTSGADHLTVDDALSWSTRGSASRVWAAARLCVVRGFARYLSVLDPATEVPPAGLIPEPNHRIVPYIYTDDDIARLLAAAGRLFTRHRAITYQTVIGLLAVTGMRGGEVVGLDRDDVDLDDGVLTIRNSKYGKSRQVMVHASTVDALANYAERRDTGRYRYDGRQHHHPPSTTSFFTSGTGTRLLRDNLSTVFARLVRDAGLGHVASGRAPRVHDLRHSFAVRTLIRWHREGADVERQLPLLSTWLGHVGPAETYWYLSAVPELLALVADRIDAISEATA